MTASVIPIGKNANYSGAVLGTENAGSYAVSALLAARLREMFPTKSWCYVCDLLGVGERVAKHRLAGTREFTADELAALLRTEEGFAFLVTVMAGAAPTWWQLCRPAMARAESEIEYAKTIKGVLDANGALNATLDRGQAALEVLDKKQGGARPAPNCGSCGSGGSAYGVLRGPMAPAGKPKA